MEGRDCYAVFEALRPDMLRMAAAIMRSTRTRMTSEDLVQAVLAHVWERVTAGTIDCDTIASPRAYAYTALSNQFLSEVRRASHSNELLRPDDTIREPAAPSSGDPGDRIAVARCVEQLDENDRRFLLRVVVEGDKVETAKRTLGWPPGTPHHHLRTLLKRLHACLDPTGGDR